MPLGLEQRQYVLRYRVGLGQNVLASLLQNLSGAHCRYFGCVVSIRDLRFSSGQVSCRCRVAFYRGFQTVLLRTQRATSAVDGLDLRIDGGQCRVADDTSRRDQCVTADRLVAAAFQGRCCRADVRHFQVDRLTVKGTDLQFGSQLGVSLSSTGVSFVAATQQLLAVERGVFTDTVHFLQASVDFVVDTLTVFVSVSTVLRLYDQLTYTLEVVGNCTQSAFSSLSHRHTIVGVTVSLFQTIDLRGHAVRDRQTSSVVFGAVDALTRRQTFNRLVLCFLGFIQIVLSQLGKRVGSNYLCHVKDVLLEIKVLGYQSLLSAFSYKGKHSLPCSQIIGPDQQTFMNIEVSEFDNMSGKSPSILVMPCVLTVGPLHDEKATLGKTEGYCSHPIGRSKSTSCDRQGRQVGHRVSDNALQRSQ
ncbi:beta-tubulin folding cofactor D [Zymobacter palmae]|uniref:Beta-tubulin folding cofactor D n=1 Tax=Zymobacter palmae TaxID=33074 RepID=A0A348HBL3_9GAMM|nr:beta-tubulin folding cofactor D [Zymobacter palmae]